MTKKTKTQSIAVPQNKEAALLLMKKWHDKTLSLQVIKAAQDEQLARIKHEHAQCVVPLNEEIAELAQAIQLYCEAHRDELTDHNRVKFADFGVCVARWRNASASVQVSNNAKALEALRQIPDYDRFIRTKQEINKDAILNERDLFELGQVPFVKVVHGGEQFSLEPCEQELAQM